MLRITNFLLIAGLSVLISCSQSEVRTTHKALVMLYKSTNGYKWHSETMPFISPNMWNIDIAPASMEDFNRWYGLTVSDGKLVQIDLGGNNLSGRLPPEIGDLTDLEFLDLSGNRLIGEIIPELEDLVNLETLDLSSNDLEGGLPPELGNLTNLESLDLSENQLTGEIPSEFAQLVNLKTMSLRGNELCIPKDDQLQAWIDEVNTSYMFSRWVLPTCD